MSPAASARPVPRRRGTVRVGAHAALALVLLATLASCGSDTRSNTKSEAPTANCPNPDGSSPKQTQFTKLPPTCIDSAKNYVATIATNHGTVHIALDQQLAPQTVNSIVYLARFHYFDATPCHRAIPSFVVQCGDPTGTGTGGPGYETPVEIGGFRSYAVGDVAMAKVSGASTNGSQFFIISGKDGAALPPEYGLFGKVDPADLPVVAALDALGNPDPSAGGVPPIEPITIQSITISPTT
ncbi:MAG: peptidylprolyl isomerase [Ilumatobacteraceae bacterium]